MSATATPDPTPAAWAPTRRCRGFPADMTDRIVDEIVKPVAAEMVRRDSTFSGLLYAGLAITSKGPAVVEFNCRFGDPETQAVLALLDSPLGRLLHATATGELAAAPALDWRDGAAVTVVVAAENYPGRPRVGDVIHGADADGVLHAGTARRDDGALVSSGGRVLSVVGHRCRTWRAHAGLGVRDPGGNSVARQPLPHRHRTGRSGRRNQPLGRQQWRHPAQFGTEL